ncbi:MAG TPA: hypothetical protein VIV55_04645 [Flavobacterium sp.]
MKTKAFGIIVIVVGILMMVYTGFNYVTTERLVEIGPIKIDKEKNHPVQWTPIIGLLVVVGGIVVLEVSGKKE